DRGWSRRGQRRNVNLVDQLAEERRLGEDLDVDELRDRLERDLRERLEPVEPAGRMDVDDGNREDDPPGDPFGPAPGALGEWNLPPADHVVALVDRREQRVEVRGGPWFTGRGDEDERCRCALETFFECSIKAASGDWDDDAFDGAPARCY